MQLRDVFAGAVATLVVTVLGGVAVFYATKEPDDKKNERLIYSVNQTALFSGGTQDLAFSSIKLTNAGGLAAKRVSVRIGFGTTELRDLSIAAGTGLRELSKDRTTKDLRVMYEAVLPGESVTFNLLLNKAERPAIEIRSEASLAEERTAQVEDPASRKAKVNSLVEKAVPLTGGLTAVMAITVMLYLRRYNFFGLGKSRNNAGFLLLHHGLIDEAEPTLSTAVRQGDFHQVTLSNYALCKAIRGNLDQAKGLLRAARFTDGSKHDRAVVLFNDGLVQLLDGKKDAAIKSLAEAISLSPKEVRRYCQRSVHLDGVRHEAAFHNLFKDV